MKNLRTNLIRTILTLVIILITVGLLIILKSGYPSGVPKGYVEVINYAESEGQTCLIASPVCGDCFGVVLEHRCFVNPKALNEQERAQVKLDT